MPELLKSIDDTSRGLIDFGYRKVVHPRITRGTANDREIAHERAIAFAERVQKNPAMMALLKRFFTFRDPILEVKLGNVTAPNPLGIAAGFDKNARIDRLLGNGLGFGIVTVGSITLVPYEGNPRPRIFDLPVNDGLINRMGFPGEGVATAKKRLEENGKIRNYTLAINVAASKPSFEKKTAIVDYGLAYSQLLPYADFCEVNVSSPNTVGVRALQDPEVFRDLAGCIDQIRRNSIFKKKPLVYKFSPDLSTEQLEKLLKIAIDNGANGVALTNTSTDQSLRNSLKYEKNSNETGGMSGAFLNSKALEATHNAYKYAGESIFIIRAGGVRGTAEDLWKALTYGGATIAEVYSSFVRPNTSTPNYTFYALRDFAHAMREAGLSSMNDFKDLRGKNVQYPLKDK